MKKYKILYGISIILLICFCVFIGIDYSNYDPIVTSAPFSTNILLRGVEFLIPSIIIFVIGIILKKKNS